MATGKEILPGTPNDIYQLIDWVRANLVSSDPVSFIPTPEEQADPEWRSQYEGWTGFIKFVWQRATIAGWVTTDFD
jgi:hypothetical protein